MKASALQASYTILHCPHSFPPALLASIAFELKAVRQLRRNLSNTATTKQEMTETKVTLQQSREDWKKKAE
jgi:hypothetical protein